MPSVVYDAIGKDGKRVFFVECEFVPALKQPDTEADLMQQIAETICRYPAGDPKEGQIRCGFLRDADRRGCVIYCFHSESPYLKQLKQQLESVR